MIDAVSRRSSVVELQMPTAPWTLVRPGGRRDGLEYRWHGVVSLCIDSYAKLFFEVRLGQGDFVGVLMAGRKAQLDYPQLTLTGFAEPVRAAKPEVTDRLFLGVFPDASLLASIEQSMRSLLRERQIVGRPLIPARYHMTLHHLGDYPVLPPERVEAALSAMGLIATTPFGITLDHAASFGGRPGAHPCVLRCIADHSGIDALWHDARVHLAAIGFAPSLQRNFTPHLTLLYGETSVPTQIPITPIAWEVREVVLVHSLLGKTQYRFLGNRQLPGARPIRL